MGKVNRETQNFTGQLLAFKQSVAVFNKTLFLY